MINFEPIQTLFNQYQPLLPVVFISFLVALILTPLTGYLAVKVGAIDSPGGERDLRDHTKERRIHKIPMPRLGGIAVFVGIMVGVFLAIRIGLISADNQQLWHILLGMTVILILGYVDSRSDITGGAQFAFQILAALIVVVGGVKILNIDVLGLYLNFDVINFTVPIGPLTLYFSPLADIITLLWIVGLINVMNWVSGIDGLAAAMSIIGALTLTFIGIKTGAIFAAVLAAITFGGILGFLPFNFPPAKTFNGSIGDMLQGFLLAVLAILSGAKMTTSIILLALPIIDAVWVLIGRYFKHRRELHGLRDLLEISDKTHLHHRLMALGLSSKQTLGVELVIFFGFCIAAYQLAGFSNETVVAMVAILVCLLIFVVIKVVNALRAKRTSRIRGENMAPINTETPEDRYAY